MRGHDPFAIRLEFVNALRRLTATQSSINKLLSLAIRSAPTSADDIWSCLMSECQKASLNARVNIFFLLDALFTDESFSNPIISSTYYLPKAQNDLKALVDMVVPRECLTHPTTGESITREGAGVKLNAASVLQILAGWKLRRVFPEELLDKIEKELQERKKTLRTQPPLEASVPSAGEKFSKNDVLRRIEEDRERHKRLRERGWILPPMVHPLPKPKNSDKGKEAVKAPSTSASPSKSKHVPSTASADAGPSTRAPVQPDAVEIEFSNQWETLSDINEDDLDALHEENTRWWGGEEYIELQLQREAERARQEALRQAELERQREMEREEEERRREKQERKERAQREAERKRRNAEMDDDEFITLRKRSRGNNDYPSRDKGYPDRNNDRHGKRGRDREYERERDRERDARRGDTKEDGGHRKHSNWRSDHADDQQSSQGQQQQQQQHQQRNNGLPAGRFAPAGFRRMGQASSSSGSSSGAAPPGPPPPPPMTQAVAPPLPPQQMAFGQQQQQQQSNGGYYQHHQHQHPGPPPPPVRPHYGGHHHHSHHQHGQHHHNAHNAHNAYGHAVRPPPPPPPTPPVLQHSKGAPGPPPPSLPPRPPPALVPPHTSSGGRGGGSSSR